MKRSLFKQFVISALFACSLSADVPDVRKQAGYDQQGINEGGRTKGGVVANQMKACSLGLCDCHAQSMPAWPSTLTAGMTPNPVTSVFPEVWPMGGAERGNIMWEVPSAVDREAMNFLANPLDTALLVPSYRMPLALQESAWQSPIGSWEPALAMDGAGRSDRAHMAAMIPRLKEIFIKQGVPQQWVWMAEIESALNPQAKSSAGAAGLFQLMPGTARRFGLQMAPSDDRMEPVKSAGAAAQYLKFLRQEFGCWSLALAAYNAGEGRVKEIMKKRKATTFNEVERFLPSETRAYVPKVMAIVALREDQLHSVPGAYWMP